MQYLATFVGLSIVVVEEDVFEDHSDGLLDLDS
jgi:hypothetical protein